MGPGGPGAGLRLGEIPGGRMVVQKLGGVGGVGGEGTDAGGGGGGRGGGGGGGGRSRLGKACMEAGRGCLHRTVWNCCNITEEKGARRIYK